MRSLLSYKKSHCCLKIASSLTLFFFISSQIGWSIDYSIPTATSDSPAEDLSVKQAQEELAADQYKKQKLKEQEEIRNQNSARARRINDLQDITNKQGIKQGENVTKDHGKKVQQEAQKVQQIQQAHQQEAQEITSQIAKYGEYYIKFNDKHDQAPEYHTDWFFNTVPVKSVWNTQLLKTGRKFIQHTFGIPPGVSIDDIQAGNWSPKDVVVTGIGEDLPYEGYEFMDGINLDKDNEGRRLTSYVSVTANTKHSTRIEQAEVQTATVFYNAKYYDVDNGRETVDRFRFYNQNNEDEIGVKTYIQ